MTQSLLRPASESFASRLNRVVAAALETDLRFVASVASNGRRANVRASKVPNRRSDGFPLVRSSDTPGVPVMFLLPRFFVEISPETARLRVATSTIGLWVDITGGRKPPRPLIRVEYDRRLDTGHGVSAHVHIHAHSPELAWLYGSSGLAAPNLHALHFPVGGRRFRPTLEDFLLFLDRENIFTHFKEGWKTTVLRSLREWEELQATSTVRRYPQVAADALRNMGYGVPRDG